MEERILKYSEKIIEYGFYALAFLVPLVFTTSTYELFEFPKMILVYLLTILIVGAFLVKSVIVGRFNLRRTPLDLPIFLYLAVYTLSTIFSIDRYTSIFGYYTRFNGGLLSLLAYVSLYYVFVWEVGGSGEKREKFTKTLLVSSVFVSVYGILQHFGIDKDYWVQDVQRRVFSTLGQPNWLAAYFVMILPVSLAYFLSVAKKARFSSVARGSYCLLPIALYSAFWFTYSRSGLLGLGVAMATFLIFLGKENLKQHWRPLLLIGIVWAVISLLTFSPTIAEKIPVARAAPEVETGHAPSLQKQTSGSTINIRLAVWKGTLNLIKDHPLLGTGPETFAYSFLPHRPVELNQTAEWEFLYNKTHNEYLNIAACTGLLGLGTYLFLIAKFIVWNIRSRFTRISPKNAGASTGQAGGSARNTILQAGLFAGWVGVLVTNFFGFSVVVTSLLFWLYMAASIETLKH